MQTNGHTLATSPAEPIARPTDQRKIELFRISGGQPVFVLTLTSEYKGLFVHYRKKENSLVCQGDGKCRHALHDISRTWKGYVPALVNVPKTTRWLPYCFEITEHLELDLRGAWAAGQTWEIYRDITKGKNGPLYGKLHLDEAPPKLPEPFSILPCLRAVYHTDVIKLDYPSPLPARVYVDEFQGPMPTVLQPKDDAGVPEGFSAAEEFERKNGEEFRRRQREAAQKRPSPTARRPL